MERKALEDDVKVEVEVKIKLGESWVLANGNTLLISPPYSHTQNYVDQFNQEKEQIYEIIALAKINERIEEFKQEIEGSIKKAKVLGKKNIPLPL
jgi:hypothetical protein